jgi:CBS domain-containing protein
MKVEQLMTKEVVTCQPDDNLNRAARIMWEKDCGFVPVVESSESQRVVGAVTDRDVCMAAYTRGQPLTQILVRDVMSTNVRTCKPSDTLGSVESKMRDAQIHRLPVVDSANQLLGVISIADIAREAAHEVGAQRRAVTTEEVGATLAEIRKARSVPAHVG